MANKLLQKTALNDQQRLTEVYELTTSRLPDQEELKNLSEGLQSMRSLYSDNLPLAREMTANSKDLSDADRVEIAAYTMIINSVFNLDVTKTRE